VGREGLETLMHGDSYLKLTHVCLEDVNFGVEYDGKRLTHHTITQILRELQY
jgi:hypothetical protein